MNLAVDIGNTKVKAGIFNGNQLVHQASFQRPALNEIKRLLQDFPTLKFCIVSSVITHSKEIINLLSHKLNCIELNFNTALPIKNLYSTPDTLGNDRLASAVGAYKRFPGKNSLVIDVGTCLKFDFITAQGEYLGGAISPGLNMRFKALNAFTDRLPLLQRDDEFESTIGRSTRESILSGVQGGMLGEIKYAIEEYTSQYSPVQFVLTGGDWQFFENALKNSIFAAPSLLLEGLNEILLFNTQKTQT